MDSETNQEISSNGIETSKSSVQNSGIKSGGTKQPKSVNGEPQVNGNDTDKNCQVKGASTKAGSGNSSVDKGKIEKTNSTEEDNTDKKASSKGSRFSSFAAPTKSSIAKTAAGCSKTPEEKKEGTIKETTVSEKKPPAKKKGFVETVREKFGPSEQDKPKHKTPEKSEVEKEKQNSKTTTDSKAKQESTLKPTESTPKPTESTTKPTESTPKPTTSITKPTESTPKPTESTPKPTGSTPKPTESTPKPTESITKPTESTTKPTGKLTENRKKEEKPIESGKRIDHQTKKANVEKILKKYQDLNRKKRIIGSEKSTLEEKDLCYLNFDYSEDYTSRRFIMAQAQIDPSQGAPKENTEYIYVSDNKLKYINKDYVKVQAKIYDHKCDVKLKVADQSFKAHRDVLSEASDYFSAMFRHDMKEKSQDVIEIKDISPKGFAAILDYFYHGHVTIDPDNIEDNIEAARFFHNDWLLEICCDFLVRHLSLENYTAVLQLTDKYWLGDLRWDIFVFLGQNLPELVQQEKFYQNLPMELILQFLMENVYVESSEYFILDFILKWVQEDPDKRKEHLLSLLRQVRFPVMEAEELESLPDEVMKIPEMKQLVEDAMNYNCNVMGQCLITGDNYLPRGARKVLAVTSFSEEYNMIAYRDPEKPGLFVEQLGPTGLDTADYHAMMQTSIGNFLYAAGGYDGNYCSIARVFRFDPKYREWLEVSPMNHPRVSFAICSSDKNVYVFGGVNHQHTEDGDDVEDILSEVEVYDPQENKWDDLAPLPIKCFDQSAAYCDGCLYVTGGISADPSDSVPLDNVWCLKINGDDGWVPKQSMNKQRQGHSMSALNGKIYVVGGYTNFGDNMTFRNCIDNEVFDIETGQWSKLAPTPENFGHLFRHVGFYEHKIYALGGSTVNTNLYVYDIDSDTWEEKEAIGPNVQKLSILSVAYPHS